MAEALRVKQNCKPRANVFETGTRDTVDALSDLSSRKIDASKFFEENHFTEGLRQLCENGLKRLAGQFDTGVFRLKQAMGGGKTHSLIAFGLLAGSQELRREVLPGVGLDSFDTFASARLICFEGRERPIHGLWGHIAKELGKESQLARFYSPLQAPGKEDWVQLIGDEPIVIMLDELPPYLEGVAAVTVGDTNLATITADALANLMMAVQEKLPRALVIITDLNSAWEGGSRALDKAVKAATLLDNEVSRSAINIEPVRLNSNELYDILRKRLFEQQGTVEQVQAVESEFRKAYERAEKSGFAASQAFGFVSELPSSYPFHPKLKELFARFKENEGFQQTRGILRMARAIVSAVWRDDACDPWLISPGCANLNDQDVFSEFKRANQAVETAINCDVANGGGAVAEKIGSVAEEVAKSILMASLARGSSQAKLGLSETEIISVLIEPERDNALIKQAIEKIRMESLYLHRSSAGELFFRENKNLTAAVRDEAQKCRPEDIDTEIKRRLREMFQVRQDSVFQDLLIFPDRESLITKVDWQRLMLAIVRPDEWGTKPIHDLPDSLKEVFEKGLTRSNRNRLLLLSLGKDELSVSIKNVRELWALRRVIAQRLAQGIRESDPEMQEAKRREAVVSGNLVQSLSNCPSHLHYPAGEICTVPVEKGNFIKNASSGANGAELVAETLQKAEKLPAKGWEAGDDMKSSRLLFESKVFTSPQSSRLELEKASADNSHWIFTRPGEFDRFMARCVKEDYWREEGAVLRKKPKAGWPKPTPEVAILRADISEAERKLGKAKVSPVVRNGDKILWEEEGLASGASKEWTGSETLDCLWASFIAVDSQAQETGTAPAVWVNPNIAIQGDFCSHPGSVTMTLELVPKNGSKTSGRTIYYTADGSNPKNPATRKAYLGPVELPQGAPVVQAVAVIDVKGFDQDGVEVTETREVGFVEFNSRLWSRSTGDGASNAPSKMIDPVKPVRYLGKSVDESGKVFRMLSFLREKNATAKFGSLVFKAGGDSGSISFSPNQNIKPESVEKLAELLQSELGAEIQKLTPNEIAFEKGSDLDEFSKSMEINVNDGDWEQ